MKVPNIVKDYHINKNVEEIDLSIIVDIIIK
jgi:hypothetical protein